MYVKILDLDKNHKQTPHWHDQNVVLGSLYAYTRRSLLGNFSYRFGNLFRSLLSNEMKINGKNMQKISLFSCQYKKK